jgi:predicted N-acetyltransferase YhbS
MDLKVVRLLSKVCAFCEEQGHPIMDCPFVPFHIKVSIAGHVELQNVARTLMDQSQDQELGIFVVHNRLRGMGLGSQLGP